MYVIIGWDECFEDIYTSVENKHCIYCNNIEEWRLKRKRYFYTFFFIPIFPQNTEYFIYCSKCKNQTKIFKKDFEDYRKISVINNKYISKKIDEIDKKNQLKPLITSLKLREEISLNKLKEEVKNWEKLASSKTNGELLEIYNERKKYNPSFYIAIEQEMEKRKMC